MNDIEERFVTPKLRGELTELQATWPSAPDDWEQAAARVVKELSFTSGWSLDRDASLMEGYYEQGHWSILGRAALADLITQAEKIERCQIRLPHIPHSVLTSMTVDKVVETLARKQSDYGPRNIDRFGQQGLSVRLWDKIARYQNLRLKGVGPQNETLEDTKMDIVGYVVIAIMLELDWFKIPLSDDLIRHPEHE